MKKKVLVLTGSPRSDGNTKDMVDIVERQAKEKGYNITIFDTCKMNINPCLACDKCEDDLKCIIKDDMYEIYPAFEEADMVIFATPLYFFSFSAQLKCAIDRLHQYTPQGNKYPECVTNKKSAMLVVAATDDKDRFTGLKEQHRIICKYLEWENLGNIFVDSCYDKVMLENGWGPKIEEFVSSIL